MTDPLRSRMCLWTLATVILMCGRTEARRNFVFILADDLGVHDLGVEGSTFYETPRIDSLAARGMRFRQGYATCQVCSPSRASILLGKFPARHGITDWIGAQTQWQWQRNNRLLPADYKRHLEHDDVTIAEALRDAGYATFFAGKWHLGSTGSHPTDHGFQINRGGYSAGSPRGGYFSPYDNPELADGPAGESLPIRLAQETVGFLEDHASESFLAFLSFYSVHAPNETSQPLWQKYRAKAGEARHERFIIDRTLPVRQVQDHPIYAGMIESMDTAVGLVLDALVRLQLADNTVVVFTSDNGGVSSGDAYSTSNLPLRGGKGRQWEGGIREPFYIVAPKVAEAGTTCDVPVTGADFYPTILELADLAPRPEQHRDGVSLVPLLQQKSIPARPLFWHYPHYGNQGGEPSSIIRRDRWKLIHYWEDDRNELYDLQDDPQESNDVAEQHPQLLADMWQELVAFLTATHAAIPAHDPRFDSEMHQQREASIRTELKPSLERQHANLLNSDWSPNPNWWGSLITAD